MDAADAAAGRNWPPATGDASAPPGMGISNEEFLRVLFGDTRWPDAHVCAVAGHPGKAQPGDWAGGRAGAGWLRHLRVETNNYFCVSTFTGDRRIEGDFEALWVIGIDDVGPKLDPGAVESALGVPTFRVETSPGNQQWFYRLGEPVTEVRRARALVHAVRVKLTGPGGRDPGQEGVTRYLRLPVGTNAKTLPVERVALVGQSDRVIEEEDLRAWCPEVPGAGDQSWSQDQNHRAGSGHPDDLNDPDDVLEANLLVRAFRELGMILGDLRDSPMGRGFDVRCPWREEHTDPRVDTGTFFAPGRGFRCHHGHCDGRNALELGEKLDELLRAESGGLVVLSSLDFDAVDPLKVPVVKIKTAGGGGGSGGGTYELTEDGLARALADQNHERLRFDTKRGQWIIWSPKENRWNLDERLQVFMLARNLARRVRQDQDGGKALAKIAAAAAIERGARADPRIATVTSDWDQDDYALNAAGVHVDLRTGTMRKLVPGDMMLHSTSVRPDPVMPTPVWDGFLWETFEGDIDLIEFIPRWFGYALTGDTSAEMFMFAAGHGNNGKGTLLHTVLEIAGGYGLEVDSGMFMEQRFKEHLTEIAQLAGVRVVKSTEVPEHARWNTTRLKQLASKEGKLSGRFMRQDNFNFKPTQKLNLVGNHKPALGTVDKAIARRLVLVPFEHTVTVIDGLLKDKLVAEYPGILWKLIIGAGETLAALGAPGGLWSLVPQSVVLASQAYLVEEDDMMSWLNESCDFVVGAEILNKELCEHFNSSAKRHSAELSERQFVSRVKQAAALLGQGLSSKRTMHGLVIIGLRLKPT